MSITNIQKKRFLETIYKIYYSLGSPPSETEVLSLYGRYFSRYKFGQSIPVPYNDLSTKSIIDQDDLNRIMVHLLFNLDIVYENFYEQVEELYEIINSYNIRIESIKAKRAEIEKKVDDHLFAIKNTDGFYYSSTNAFNTTDMTDLNLTSAFVDIESRKVTLPKLTSGLFNYVGNIINSTTSADVSISFEGNQVKQDTVDFSSVFNGLSNSEWRYTHQSSSIGICTLKISIPITSITDPISLVEGRVSSQKPIDIGVVLVNPENVNSSQGYSKSQSSDYDRFSFNFTPQRSNLIEIYFTKAEPDYSVSVNDNLIYNYDFRIQELIITAPYYDSYATLVSTSVSLPNQDNKKLSIDAVSVTVEEQTPEDTDIIYYVSEDNPAAISLSDFNWKIISPSNVRDPNYSTVVNFNGTDEYIATLSTSEDGSILSDNLNMYKIPRVSEYSNPINNYFYSNDSTVLDFNLYRLAKFSDSVKPYNCYILENVDSNQLTVNLINGYSVDRDTWQQVISGKKNDITYTTYQYNISNTQNFFTAQNIPYGSMRLSTNIYSDNNIEITDKFLKSLSAQYWDIKIYLNGAEITSGGLLAAGILSSNLTWNIKKGTNDLVIIINKSTNNTSGTESPFNGSISLFEQKTLLSIQGIKTYKNYLYEVKIEDLRSYYSNSDNVFSIIKYQNNYEIVYRRTEEIMDGSKIYYYNNKENSVKAIRFRADLFRGKTAYSSPAISSYSIKFKH